jgi:hypothetical protein
MQPAEYEQTKMHNQNSKRFRPPTLSECLGEEGVKRLRAMEENSDLLADNQSETGLQEPVIISEERKTAGEEEQEEGGGSEATGPGAPGQLTGANDSACQAP